MESSWKQVKLGEVCSKIGSGATPKGGKEAYKSSGISIIRSQNILDFNFSIDGLAFIDDVQAAKLNNVVVEENDILLNITGDSVARCCKVNKDYLPARVNQHVAIIRANNTEIISDFILYLLQWRKGELLQLASAGATRNALTKIMLEKFECLLPPLQTQKQIAKTLSSIDDKIELNNKINDNLVA